MDDAARQRERLERIERIEALLSTVIDPEIGIDVVSLGLVYGISVTGTTAQVTYTLTTPACPVGDLIEREMEEMARQAEGVAKVEFERTFEPPWSVEMLSDRARRMLGWPEE